MNKHEQYWYRKAHGLCVNCGKPNDNGKTRCEECSVFLRFKQNERYKNMSAEEKALKVQKHREYLEQNPEKAALYKSRQPIYGKRYREKEKTRYEW